MDAKPAARLHRYAGMAELADAQDLGSCEAIRVGSTPTIGTTSLVSSNVYKVFLLFRQFARKTFGYLCRNIASIFWEV